MVFRGETKRDIGNNAQFTGLLPGNTYDFQVASVYRNGQSSYSDVLRVTPLPRKPLGVCATAGQESLTIYWQEADGAAGYEVNVNDTLYPAQGTEKTITGLKPKTKYRYCVRGVNDGGAGRYSYTSESQTEPAPPPPPSGINAAPTADSVRLTWEPVSGATGYDVIFDGSELRTPVYTMTVRGLQPEKLYTYCIRTRSSDGEGPYTPEQTVRTLKAPAAPPPMPEGVRAQATQESVTLLWNPSAGASSYKVRFGGKTYGQAATQRTMGGLAPDTDYAYQVCACNAAGESAYSKEQVVRTLCPLPEAPAGIRAEADEESVTLCWEPAKWADGYEVLFSGTRQETEETSFRKEGLNPGTVYSYAVRSQNKTGESAWSPTATVSTRLAVPRGIEAQSTSSAVTLSWEAVEGADAYDVRFDGETVSSGETAYPFTGLAPETLHTYAVRAKNAAVTGEYSEEGAVRTLSDTPAVPKPRAQSTLNDVTVAWDPVAEAISYEVEFDGAVYPVAGESAGLRLRKAAGEEIGKTFPGYAPDTTHSYRVRANGRKASSAYSEKETIRTKKRRRGLPDLRKGRTIAHAAPLSLGLDPVNAVTGAFVWSHTCLEDLGKDGLDFTLMYDSQGDLRGKELGERWTHALAYRLFREDGTDYFGTPYGEVTPFEKEDDRNPYTLLETEDGWCVSGAGGSRYCFDRNRKLTELEEPGRGLCRFLYGPEGTLSRIAGSRASLLFTYEGGRISKVSHSGGRETRFSYTGSFLTGLAGPEETAFAFAYGENGLLLEVTARDTLLVRSTYDLYGRVTSQDTAGGGKSFASYDLERGRTVFTDATGKQTAYSYDEGGRITRVEQEGTGAAWAYDETGRAVSCTDGLGRATAFAYDGAGRLSGVTYPDGLQETVAYNDQNLPVEVTNPDGTKLRYEYDAQGRLVRAEDERGNACAYTYNSQGELAAYVDKTGGLWTYEYDQDHHLSGATDPEGTRYAYAYDKAGRLLSHTLGEGRATRLRYSPEGDLLEIWDEEGSTSFTYDRNGGLLSVTDRMGNTAGLTYQETGEVSRASDFLGKETRYTYDAQGRLVKETGPRGYSRTYAYDRAGRLSACTDPGGGRTAGVFDAAGQLIEVRDAAGSLTRYSYDTRGRVSVYTDACGNKTRYAYDAAGRVTRVTNALGESVGYTYDPCGNLLSKTKENGETLTYAYDKEHRLISVTSGQGTTRFTYDRLGRLVCTQDPEGYEETAAYDRDGKPVAVTDKENHTTRYQYDALGRLQEQTDALGGKTVYAYDKNGNCIRVTDALGGSSTYAYDANGRVKKAADPLGNETAYTYDEEGNLTALTDPLGRTTRYTYDANGNVTREESPLGGTVTYTYDVLNRLTGVTDEEGEETAYAYDANGNRIACTDANGTTWRYTYDALNRLIAADNEESGRLCYAYTKTGQLERVTDPEGISTCYQYDAQGRLSKLFLESMPSSEGTPSLEGGEGAAPCLRFAYDRLGRIVSQTDANGNTTRYAYTPCGNLESVEDGEGNSTSYTYNALGQVLTETDALGRVTAYESNALGQVTAITDPLGARTCFAYTGNGRIASVTDALGGVTSY